MKLSVDSNLTESVGNYTLEFKASSIKGNFDSERVINEQKYTVDLTFIKPPTIEKVNKMPKFKYDPPVEMKALEGKAFNYKFSKLIDPDEGQEVTMEIDLGDAASFLEYDEVSN